MSVHCAAGDRKATDSCVGDGETPHSTEVRIEEGDQNKEDKVEGEEYESHGDDQLPYLTDDSADLDGEVGKRLNHMVPVPVSIVSML